VSSQSSLSRASHPQTAAAAAQQILAAHDAARPHLTQATVAALKDQVDAHKYCDPTRALQIAQTALAVAALIADEEATALASWAAGTAHVYLFQIHAAQEHYQRAAAIYTVRERWLELVSVQAPLVYVLNARGDADAALALAECCRQRCHALGAVARPALVNLEMNVGTIHKQQGRFIESLRACDRATAAATALHDRASLARIDINRANVYQEMDRFADAERLYRAARIALRQEAGNQQQVALVDLNLGLLADCCGRYLDALRHLERARDSLLPETHTAWVDFNRARIYNRLHLNCETIILVEGAARVLAQNDSVRELAMALHVGALAHMRLGHTAEADALLESARQLFAQQDARVMLSRIDLARATVRQQVADHDAARRIVQRLVERVDPHVGPTIVAQAYLIRATCALEQQPRAAESAVQDAEQALTLVREEGAPELRIRAHHLLGRAHAHRKDSTAAWRHFLHAIALTEALRAGLQVDEFQLGFTHERLAIYTDAVDWLLHNAEWSSMHWHDVLYLLTLPLLLPMARTAMPDSETDDALYAELTQLRAAWHWHQHKRQRRAAHVTEAAPFTERAAEWDGVAAQLTLLEAQIADAWRRVRVRHSDQRPRTITPVCADETQFRATAHELCAAVQTKLHPHDVLLQYFLSGDHIHVLRITPAAIVHTSLGPAAPVTRAMRAWRYHVRDVALIGTAPDVALSVAQRALQALHHTLIEPVLPAHLGEAERRLYIVLPPNWHEIPFAALSNGQSSLLECAEIIHLSSAAALLERSATVKRPPDGTADLTADLAADTPTDGTPNGTTRALVVGYSVQNTLPHNVHEATQIAHQLRRTHDTTLLLEEEATTDRFYRAARRSDLIHLATHATFHADNPLFSWLQLADAQLTVADLYHGALLENRPLVVLSACETGRGDVRGSGLLGFARALQAAGAGPIIATQWRVDDATTARLMDTFYRRWADDTGMQRNIPAMSAALRAAQLTLACDSHPFYWAGVVFITG